MVLELDLVLRDEVIPRSPVVIAEQLQFDFPLCKMSQVKIFAAVFLH